jgi:RNA polymerase sigma-70 factor, ECF subfamily
MDLRTTASPIFTGLARTLRREVPDRAAEEVTALFDQFRGPLLRYLSSFRLDHADAEEIVQEVFLSLFQHLGGGKPLPSPAGWIFRVAHNLAVRQTNRARRTCTLDTAPQSGEIADGAFNPEDQFAHSEIRRRLMGVVNALSQVDRQCIYLRSEGVRYRDIAAILGISLGSVAASLARSLARVSRCAEGRNR